MHSPIMLLYTGRKGQITDKTSQSEPLHREQIMARLRMKYGSAAAFERENGLRERSVRDVLSAGKKVRKTAEAIAVNLGIPVHLVSRTYFEEQYPIGSDSSS